MNLMTRIRTGQNRICEKTNPKAAVTVSSCVSSCVGKFESNVNIFTIISFEEQALFLFLFDTIMAE